ncbi:Ornithine aminotransferase [Pseudomonas amygdali pv. tabaci]|uniref:Ornithine aminotransferase n=1 Tax=Pseudomonas amygdali pv. tabaci TaxID=322 RepID=A0A3M6FYK2_PSEAJ|nr:Ornithine aminotransferase [Pseudomonas amygdali pv. tabaci]
MVNAVLDVVSDPAFCERVNELGQVAMDILRKRLQDCPAVAEVRGSGLMIGVEFTSSNYVAQTLIEAAHRNVLLAFCLSATRVLRVYPDATITRDDLEQGINSFCDAVDAAYRSIQ